MSSFILSTDTGRPGNFVGEDDISGGGDKEAGIEHILEQKASVVLYHVML